MTERPVKVVFDTTAVLAFTRGSLSVGELLAELIDEGAVAAVPVTCLAQATPSAVEAERLEALVGRPATEVVVDAADGWRGVVARSHILSST